MADTPEIKQEKQTTTAVEKTNEKLDTLNETITKQLSGVTAAVNKPPKKDTEGIQEAKRNNKNILDTLKGIRDSFKIKLGQGAGGLMAVIKKVFKFLIRNFMKIVTFGMIGLLTLVDMKQLRELWIAFKGAFIAMYKVLAPIAKALWKWTNETLIPATVKGIIKGWGAIEKMFVSIKENFEGWDQKDDGEKIEAVLKSFKSIGIFFADTGKILINWIGKLFGVKGDIVKDADKEGPGMKKDFMDKLKDASITIGTGLLGMFAVGKLFGKGWVGKMITLPFRLAIRALLFSAGGLVNVLAMSLGMSYRVPGAFGGGKGDVDGKKIEKDAGDKKPKTGPGRDSKGRFVAKQKGIWTKVVGMFGKGKGLFIRIGSALLMPLMSMGPLGWGLLAGLALGGIVLYFWKDISDGVETAFKFMKDSVKELVNIMKGVMGGAKKMAVNALRKVGLDALADKLEGTGMPDRPRTPTEEENAVKLKKLKKQEEGKARFFKDPKKKLEMMQEEWDLQGRIMDEAGKYTDQQNVQKHGKALARQRKLTQLMDQVRKGEKKNEEKRKQLAFDELKRLKLIPDELLNVDISGTGQAGFDKLSADSKMKTNLLAKLLGGVRMTSGARDKDTGDEAMLWSKDGMRKYKKKWRDLLTEQGISLDSAPGSKERQQAIDALRKGGMTSQHEHGNAIDFSYPYPFSKKNFSGLKTTLLGAFPGATIIPESDHVHMSFDKNKSGMQVAQLQTETSQLNIAGNGQNGNAAGDVTSINTQVTNQSPSFSVNGKTPRNQVVENAKG